MLLAQNVVNFGSNSINKLTDIDGDREKTKKGLETRHLRQAYTTKNDHALRIS